MQTRKAIVFIALGLTAGLVLGSFGIASAASPAVWAPQGGPGATEAAAPPADGARLRIGPALRESGGRLADIVAELTGLSLDEVFELRADGASYADIAASKGVDADDVLDAALDARKELLDEKVAEGAISADVADAVLARMESNLSERIASMDERGPRGEGRRGGGRGTGGGRGACDGSCAAPDAAPGGAAAPAVY